MKHFFFESITTSWITIFETNSHYKNLNNQENPENYNESIQYMLKQMEISKTLTTLEEYNLLITLKSQQ